MKLIHPLSLLKQSWQESMKHFVCSIKDYMNRGGNVPPNKDANICAPWQHCIPKSAIQLPSLDSCIRKRKAYSKPERHSSSSD
ncbi:hypothetical protein PG1511B_1469 [Bifidobacterium pseudolongum subsp. globosum]|nr:hypothetical protein PG1511B_1469 [Bifidobacterium pseudolongum subsp. globosum]